MADLMPAVEAEVIRQSVSDYLTTTFALTDEAANQALEEFLADPDHGIFKGPFVRTRLPYRPSVDVVTDLSWFESYRAEHGFHPYGHQVEAFARLTSHQDGRDVRPQPTMVTTGTGSGKTETFLFPILDHVLRAKRVGKPGIKALILYPMNALANDQAQRLTRLLMEQPELRGITAGIYTGQKDGDPRTVVTSDGLITDRFALREDPPDILLTNYKMLDQLLLRAEDQSLWEASADSLQYLVLDEFHTYDGAQGTDVAMLLRRLGMALRSYSKEDSHSAEAGLEGQSASIWDERPLGNVTPVGTSATLGSGNTDAMRAFAQTIFGEPFEEAAIIGETRMTLPEWVGDAKERLADLGLVSRTLADADAGEYAAALLDLGDRPDADTLALHTIPLLVAPGEAMNAAEFEAFVKRTAGDVTLQELVLRGSDTVEELLASTAQAVRMGDLPELFLPKSMTRGRMWRHRKPEWDAVFRGIISLVGNVRAKVGRTFPSIEVHYWLRELKRIDRSAEAAPEFSWSDDARVEVDLDEGATRPRFPAIYCRRCGRSGWKVGLGAVGDEQGLEDEGIRRDSAKKTGRTRSLIYAPKEGRIAQSSQGEVEGLHWWNTRDRDFSASAPQADSDDYQNGWVLPVLKNTGQHSDEEDKEDVCPACGKKDVIRFLGSAVSTLVSVSLSTLFAARSLSQEEKRALVFADSVQDAAHRAGFIQARAHSLTLRSILAEVVGEEEMTLAQLVSAVMLAAGDDPIKRYRLLPPDITDWDIFAAYWQPEGTTSKERQRARVRTEKRLLFDAAMEFGTFQAVGRTLEMTGTVSAHVEAGEDAILNELAQAALEKAGWQQSLDDLSEEEQRQRRIQWVRGVLEHIRTQGGIDHPWLHRYQAEDGKRFRIWGGRKREEGMPAFPSGRSAPSFPKVGGGASKGELESVANPRSWSAVWSGKTLGVPAADGGRLTAALLAELSDAGVLAKRGVETGGDTFAIQAKSVILRRTSLEDLHLGRAMLQCDVCSALVPGSAETVAALSGAPCLHTRCNGHLRPHEMDEGFYRRMYQDASMRRLIAREHTGLLEDEVRREYEDEFKAGAKNPSSPNVLVATPTLEMGIDIGDLSAVYLSSLPRTVASYTQRVGRAGRQGGNTLAVTLAPGKRETLPRVLNPLSVIEGAVAPPATYLSAREILRRQFTAALFDSFARMPHRPHPRNATQVMSSTDDHSILGQIIQAAEEKGPVLEEFAASFDNLDQETIDSLDLWVSPLHGPGSSEFAHEVMDASARWNAEVETLTHRITALDEVIPTLEKRASAPHATKEDERELRSAEAARKLALGRRSRLQGKYWISVLEEAGLLPNYTLLDDTSTLGVGVSRRNPETGQRDTESLEVSRPSAMALREFAPGTKFYTRGLEIDIDAIDLGADAEAIRKWRLCDQCGFGIDVSEYGKSAPTQCPRCGSGGIADMGQEVNLVEFRRATAEVRRDEAAISDRADERFSKRFDERVTIDLDPDSLGALWGEKGSGLGWAYFNQATVRQLNLGRSGQGPTLKISGDDSTPSLFTVCEGCGKLQIKDDKTGRRHRAWCKYRKEESFLERTVALAHTLQTQALVIYPPPQVTLADSFAIPSLVAAIWAGLTKVLGGDPEHLQIIMGQVPEPDGEGGREAIILHDRIPGGTGYLTEWSEPEQLHRVLTEAWKVVAGCECAHDERQACDQCLLPYAPKHMVGSVSRAAAQTHLETLLGLKKTGEGDGEISADLEPSLTDWDLEEGKVRHHQQGETVLEFRLRKVLEERLKKMGAALVPKVAGGRYTLDISLPGGGGRRWILLAQEQLPGTKPDLVLRCEDPNIPPVAIYADGWQFHATEENQDLAGDARKRQSLRDGIAGTEFGVLAVTMADVENAEAGLQDEPFIPADLRRKLLADPRFQSTPDAFDRQGINPVDWLIRWIEKPEVADIRAAAKGLLLADADRARRVPTLPGESAAETLARIVIAAKEGTDIPTDGASSLAALVTPGLGSAALIKPVPDGPPLLEMALVIDDRRGHVADKNAWQQWLRTSNAAIFRREPTTITTVTGAKAQTVEAAEYPGDGALTLPISTKWQTLIDEAYDEEETAILERLALLGLSQLPTIGDEGPKGIPLSIAWPQKKVALATSASDQSDINDLRAEAWTVLGANDKDLRQKLAGAGI